VKYDGANRYGVQELDQTSAHNYDVSHDGQRFLMVGPVAQEPGAQARPRIIIVENWFEELKRLCRPTDRPSSFQTQRNTIGFAFHSGLVDGVSAADAQR
jgi:hypothetical protein